MDKGSLFLPIEHGITLNRLKIVFLSVINAGCGDIEGELGICHRKLLSFLEGKAKPVI
jgi:hypothetical protein